MLSMTVLQAVHHVSDGAIHQVRRPHTVEGRRPRATPVADAFLVGVGALLTVRLLQTRQLWLAPCAQVVTLATAHRAAQRE